MKKKKPQWDIASHLFEWLLLKINNQNKKKNDNKTGIGKNEDELGPLCVAGRNNVKWCSSYRKQYRLSKKSNSLKN